MGHSIDREKVIKGLRCIIDGTVRCESCGYSIDKHGHHSCQQECAKDAIALLKEQEAVEPYMDYDGHDVWRCGNCGATIFHIEQSQADEDWKNYAKFCRQCGKKVKWE